MPVPDRESTDTPTAAESMADPKRFCAAARGALFLWIGAVLTNRPAFASSGHPSVRADALADFNHEGVFS